jgi:hypothetical protein
VHVYLVRTFINSNKFFVSCESHFIVEYFFNFRDYTKFQKLFFKGGLINEVQNCTLGCTSQLINTKINKYYNVLINHMQL